MPLDEYKTQVLLLHSEQSTLDNLSSGFNDRYTVHCATSGSEALNTLVDTPINVIITAQDLPGMSGLEALREAKKRSPDTIGILLAGNKTTDIEALVGDEEVFQVVSGTVTGDGLLQLVDSATRQMRLMALAESANDTTAGVDEPAEHIVMETSENGSTIISDGTGRMPVLDPKKVSAAASVGSRSVDILVLTKDQEFLETIKDSSRGMHKVFYANTLAQANEAIRTHKIGVAVVDAAMVGEKIEQLTQHLRKGSPRLVSIVAGRRDDGEMLMDLINRGKVYRFLLKPVSPGRARLAVESSVKHHLEAPDAAFLAKGAPPPSKPAAKPATPPAQASKPAAAPRPATPQSNAAQKPVTTNAPKPVEKTPSGAEKAPIDPPLGSTSASPENSPIEDGLADAFGQDDPSFTETVTGLISSVGKRFSKDTQNADADPIPAPTSTDALLEDTPMLSSGLTGDGGDGSVFSNPKIMGFAAAAVIIVAAALFWFVSASDEGTVDGLDGSREIPDVASDSGPIGESDTATEPAAVFDELPLASDSGSGSDGAALLEDARLARDAGQIYSPAGQNAIELYGSALNADPSNSILAEELDAVVGQALSLAESAMLESRTDDAAAALSSVASVAPDNARLPFLTAQLTQMQLRGNLDTARAAIREDRYEDAFDALSAARRLSITDTTEIDAITAELNAARSAQQVDDVLAKATASLNAGKLLIPANDNARYYYELVLTNDPDNVAARQGLSVIAGKLAFQARTEIDNGNLTLAENTLANARALDRSNSEVAAVTTELADARTAAAEAQRLAAEAERAAEAQREADRQAAAAAERLAAATNAIDSSTESARPTTQKLSGGNLVSAADSLDNADDSSPLDATSARSDAGGSPAGDIGADVPALTPPLASQTPTAISQLNRMKYVAPKYPRSAARRNISGWVDIVFTVATDGTVTDIDIRGSEPGDTFVKAAISAVEKWEFEPVVENGALVPKRAGVRMMFALE